MPCQGLVGYDTSASAVALITAKTVGISHWSLDALCGAQLLGSVGGIVWVPRGCQDGSPGAEIDARGKKDNTDIHGCV